MRAGTITSVAQKLLDKFERGEPVASGGSINKPKSSKSGCTNAIRSRALSANWPALMAYAEAVIVASLKSNCGAATLSAMARRFTFCNTQKVLQHFAIHIGWHRLKREIFASTPSVAI